MDDMKYHELLHKKQIVITPTHVRRTPRGQVVIYDTSGAVYVRYGDESSFLWSDWGK